MIPHGDQIRPVVLVQVDGEDDHVASPPSPASPAEMVERAAPSVSPDAPSWPEAPVIALQAIPIDALPARIRRVPAKPGLDLRSMSSVLDRRSMRGLAAAR